MIKEAMELLDDGVVIITYNSATLGYKLIREQLVDGYNILLIGCFSKGSFSEEAIEILKGNHRDFSAAVDRLHSVRRFLNKTKIVYDFSFYLNEKGWAMDSLIQALPLSTRTKNIFMRNGIERLSQIEVANLPNFRFFDQRFLNECIDNGLC